MLNLTILMSNIIAMNAADNERMQHCSNPLFNMTDINIYYLAIILDNYMYVSINNPCKHKRVMTIFH